MKSSKHQHHWISRADLNNINHQNTPVASSAKLKHNNSLNISSCEVDDTTPIREGVNNNVPLSHKTRPPPPKRPQSLPPMMTTSLIPTTTQQPLESGGRGNVLPNTTGKLSAHFAPLSKNTPSSWVPLNVGSQAAAAVRSSTAYNNNNSLVGVSSASAQPETATTGDHLLRILNGGETGRKMIPPTSVALDRLDELFSFVFSTYFTQQSASSDTDPSDLLVRLQRRESLASSIRKIHQQQQASNKNGGVVSVHQSPPTRDPVLSYYMLFKKLISDRIRVSSRPIRVMESLIQNWQRRVLTVAFMSWRFQSKLSRTLWSRNVECCENKYRLKLLGWRRACFVAWRSHAHLKHKREHVLDSEDTRTKLAHRMGRRIEELELENKILRETVARLSMQRREVEGDLKVLTEVVTTRLVDVHAPSDLYTSFPPEHLPPPVRPSQGGGGGTRSRRSLAISNVSGIAADNNSKGGGPSQQTHTTLKDYILPSDPPEIVVALGEHQQQKEGSQQPRRVGEEDDHRRPSTCSLNENEAPSQLEVLEDADHQQSPRGRRFGESTTTVVPHGARGSVTRGPNREDSHHEYASNSSVDRGDSEGHVSSRALSPLLPSVLLERSLPLSVQSPAAATSVNSPFPPPKHSDVLNWVSVRCQLMLAFGAPPRRLTNFGSDFKDGVRLAYLLVSLGFSRTAARKTLRLRKKRRRAALIEMKGSVSSSDLSPISSSTEEEEGGLDNTVSSSSPQHHVLLRARRQAELCGLVEEVSNPLLSIDAKEVLLTDALRCFIDLAPLIVVNPSVKDGSRRTTTSSTVGARTGGNNSVVGGNKPRGGAFAELFEATISEPHTVPTPSNTSRESTRNDPHASSRGGGEDGTHPSSLPPPTATSLPLLSSSPNYMARVIFAVYQRYHTASMNIAVRAPVSDEVGLLVVRHYFPEREAMERDPHNFDHDDDEGNDSGSGAVSSCQDDALDIDTPPRSHHGEINKVSGKAKPARIGGVPYKKGGAKRRKKGAGASPADKGLMELFRKEYPAEHYTALYTDLAHSDTDSERDYRSLSVSMPTKH